MLKRTALILAAFGLLSAGNASGASLGGCGTFDTWTADVMTDLSAGSGNTCSLGELEFGNFLVSSPLVPGIISINLAPFTNDDGGIAWISFEFNPQGPGPGNYIWQYTVTANEGFELFGLDAQFGTGHPTVQMTEIGCKSDPLNGCVEGDLLGSLAIDNDPETATSSGGSFFFEPVEGTIWVKKDMTITDKDGFISDINNSHHYQRGGDIPVIPEPATMLLFSTALLGLGWMRRKKS